MELKTFITGDSVTAEFMSELAKTVVDAEKNANEARTKSNQAIETANSAKKTSENVEQLVNDAYATAVAVETRANNGEFNGKSIFIKFNTAPMDSGASETWQKGMDYIGFAIAHGSISPETGYFWAKFTGETGEQGPEADLSNCVTINTSQIISAIKTFSAGVKMGSNWTISTNSSNELVFTYTGV